MLKRYEDRLLLPKATPNSDPSWFAFPITVRAEAGFTRNELTQHLESRKIETRNLFSGNLLRHPAFDGIPCRIVGDLKNTDLITTNTFFVGIYPGLTDVHLTYMASMFEEFMGSR
jgi:CDP-6-deoxy-D-xylo-4-hexulose-3-dehydrase